MRTETFWLPLGGERCLVLNKRETEMLHRACTLLDDVRMRLAQEYADADAELEGVMNRLDHGWDQADETHDELATAAAHLGEVLERYRRTGGGGKLWIRIPD